MTEVLLCSQVTQTSHLKNQCGLSPEFIHGSNCVNPDRLNSYTPYLMSEDPSAKDRDILRLLSTPSTSRQVTDLSLTFGGDNTLAIADIYDKLKGYNLGLMGAGTSVYGHRLKGFGEVVSRYQASLLDYRDTMKGSSSSAARALAKQRAVSAFQNMQLGFKHELNAVTMGVKAGRRGTPLTNVTRGTNIARSSRNVATLNLTSRVQASQLVRLGSHAKMLGNGLAIIDFGGRIGNIKQSYQSGQNWERDLFIESSSFAASAGVGLLALGVFTAATPVGWVILIAGAAAASMGANYAVKNKSGELYDAIMQSLN